MALHTYTLLPHSSLLHHPTAFLLPPAQLLPPCCTAAVATAPEAANTRNVYWRYSARAAAGGRRFGRAARRTRRRYHSTTAAPISAGIDACMFGRPLIPLCLLKHKTWLHLVSSHQPRNMAFSSAQTLYISSSCADGVALRWRAALGRTRALYGRRLYLLLSACAAIAISAFYAIPSAACSRHILPWAASAARVHSRACFSSPSTKRICLLWAPACTFLPVGLCIISSRCVFGRLGQASLRGRLLRPLPLSCVARRIFAFS